MKRIGRQLWAMLRGGGLALLLGSLVVGLVPIPGLAASAARAAVPLPPSGVPEEEKRDADEKENTPVGHMNGRSRKPCRLQVVRATSAFRCPAGCAPRPCPSPTARPVPGACSVLRC